MFAIPAIPAKRNSSTKYVHNGAESHKTGECDCGVQDGKSSSNNNAAKTGKFPFNYTEPEWSIEPAEKEGFFFLEEIKEGVSLKRISLCEYPFLVVGRLDTSDVVCDHPSVSRYHVILQHGGSKGEKLFLFDLGSTHGTKINKKMVDKRTFIELRDGYILQFGSSSRIYLVNERDSDRLTLLPVSATKKEAVKGGGDASKDYHLLSSRQRAIEDSLDKLWFKKDPRGTLQLYFKQFDDISYSPEFTESVDMKVRNHHCLLSLPIAEDAFEESGFQEALDVENYDLSGNEPKTVNGQGIGLKKREAEIDAALDGCKKLFLLGLLKPSYDEPLHAKKQSSRKTWDEEGYLSDEDSYLDRTDELPRKQNRRLKLKRKGDDDSAETYDSLLHKQSAVAEEIAFLEKEIGELERVKRESDAKTSLSKEEDSLDLFMASVKTISFDKNQLRKLNREYENKKEYQQQIERLLEISKPAFLFSRSDPIALESSESVKARQVSTSTPNEACSDNGSSSCKLAVADKATSSLRNTNAKNAKKKRVTGPVSNKFDLQYEDGDNWLPPLGQTGDGKTYLNARYGY
eukprot:Nk52_evm118s224 gene=Nk52_evmTU118s224